MQSESMQSGAPWKVLLVDDELAVHEVSRLILRGLTFEGVAVDLLSATSAAQARELLCRHPDIALVMLDVVMETDDAGMRLIEFVRGQLGNRDVQIVLRTGQPGMAPEREVIVDYEVNGYLLKTDITAQRLHSAVIAALRGYRHARSLRRGKPDDGVSEPRARRGPELIEGLADAGRNGRIVLQAQAQLRLDSLSLHGIDLIALWNTQHGLMSAEQIAGRLGEGGARVQTMRWLLDQGVSWGRQWQQELGTGLRVCLPLIGEFLDDREYQHELVHALGDVAVPGLQLDLLLSHAVVLRAEPSLVEAMKRLRQVGVGFVFRDFGAATIALPYLSSLAFESVKMPHLFIEGAYGHSERATMARSLIALAHTLGATCIAEGVDSDVDVQFLRWEGCDVVQGPAVAPVCPVPDLITSLHNGTGASH